MKSEIENWFPWRPSQSSANLRDVIVIVIVIVIINLINTDIVNILSSKLPWFLLLLLLWSFLFSNQSNNQSIYQSINPSFFMFFFYLFLFLVEHHFLQEEYLDSILMSETRSTWSCWHFGLWNIFGVRFSAIGWLPHGLMVKTSSSHDGSTDSNPVAGSPS